MACRVTCPRMQSWVYCCRAFCKGSTVFGPSAASTADNVALCRGWGGRPLFQHETHILRGYPVSPTHCLVKLGSPADDLSIRPSWECLRLRPLSSPSHKDSAYGSRVFGSSAVRLHEDAVCPEGCAGVGTWRAAGSDGWRQR